VYRAPRAFFQKNQSKPTFEIFISRRKEKKKKRFCYVTYKFFGVRNVRREGIIVREVSRLEVGSLIIGRFSPGLNYALTTKH
jgi:hypothetical protein